MTSAISKTEDTFYLIPEIARIEDNFYLILKIARIDKAIYYLHTVIMVWFGSWVWHDSYLELDLARHEGETAVHLLQAVQINGLVWRFGSD